MSSPNLDALESELSEALSGIADQFEGFEDLERLNIGPEAKAQVNFDINAAKRRVGLVEDALAALRELIEDGYPDLPIIEVKESVYMDLANQERTIEAALARYRPIPDMAVGGTVTIE